MEWINRYEMRFVEGDFPAAWDGTDHGISRTRLWVRDDPPRPLDFASLAALSDVFFPRVWRRRASPVPIGTVSMTVYFHADAGAAAGHGHRLPARPGAGAGVPQRLTSTRRAQLWSEAGALLVTTHQIVYYKE